MIFIIIGIIVVLVVIGIIAYYIRKRNQPKIVPYRGATVVQGVGVPQIVNLPPAVGIPQTVTIPQTTIPSGAPIPPPCLMTAEQEKALPADVLAKLRENCKPYLNRP